VPRAEQLRLVRIVAAVVALGALDESEASDFVYQP
jgi:hypothetical protein